jgi:hypothetical protein
MNLKQAIEILRKWVERDRRIRLQWEVEPESGFDRFCEERNIAIETVLKEVEVE